jgi:hypothetical protein
VMIDTSPQIDRAKDCRARSYRAETCRPPLTIPE